MADNVLVRPKKVEERTAGGIFIPEDTKEREQFGQIEGDMVAASPGAFRYNYPEWPDGVSRPQVGDRVIFSRYQATEVKGRDGEKYWLMKDTSIAGVLA